MMSSVSDPGSFVRIRIGLYFLSPDPDQPKNPDPIRKIRIWIREKSPKNCKYKYKIIFKSYLTLSTQSQVLNTIHFSQVPPKPNPRT